MKHLNILAPAACSLALGIATSYSIGNTDAESIVINSIFFICSLAIVCSFYRISNSLRKSAVLEDEFMKSLGRVSYYRDSKLPIISSINRAANSCENKGSKSILRGMSARIRLGECISNAVESATMDEKRIYTSIKPYIGSGDFNFSEAFSAYQSRKRERESRASSIITRYSTLNMFLSTVAPSFILFSFIGSMLISQKGSGIEIMSFSLLIVIPVIYALSNSMLSRRLYG